MDFRKMRAMFRQYRAGAPLGDVAALKFDALSAPPAGISERLRDLEGYSPEHDLEKLRKLPAGTLGREYARFLEANGITPLEVSAQIRQRFSKNPYVLRYTATHDLHHLLTGFDAGLAGEAGVFAFTVGQGSAPGGRGLLWLVRLLHPLLAPFQARRLWHNIRVGRALGKRAKLLIAQPIESHFEEPLESVRARFDLPVEPARAGVQPSRRSVYQDWMFARRPRKAL